jgi:hypothetical protein
LGPHAPDGSEGNNESKSNVTGDFRGGRLDKQRAAFAQDRGERNGQNQHTKFDEHDQKVTHDWYSQHQSNPPAGFRERDRFSADEESRLHEGALLDKNLRRKVHAAPQDLVREYPAPPPNHRYAALGSHVALVDNGYEVKAVIHLHDGH